MKRLGAFILMVTLVYFWLALWIGKSKLKARLVILKKKEAFSENLLLRAYYVRFDWSGWIVLIKSEILITTGMKKWKAPFIRFRL